MSGNRFTSEARARYVAFRQAGLTTSEACAATPVSRQTVHTWLSRGRGPNPTAEEREFSEALDQALDQARDEVPTNGHAAPLEEGDLIEVLEAAARRRNATAAARLLRRAERKAEQAARDSEAPVFGDPDYVDPTTWLDPDAMAELASESLRQRAREVYVAETDAHPPGWLSVEEWQLKRALILSGSWDVLPAEPRSAR